MSKKLLIKQTKQVFHTVNEHSWLQRMATLPTIIRSIVWVFLILLGILGVFTPIPFWVVFLIAGCILFFGIAKTRNIVFRLIYSLRIHILYGKFYMWWNKNK